MRSDKEIAAEALWRAALIRSQRKRERERLATGTVLAVCLSLAVCVYALSGLYPGAGPPMAAAQQNLPMMFPDAGSYVLCGVICFALGCAAALFGIRQLEKNGNLPKKNKEDAKNAQN